MSRRCRLLSLLLCCGPAFASQPGAGSGAEGVEAQGPHQRASTPRSPSPVVVPLSPDARTMLQRHPVAAGPSAAMRCEGVALSELLQATGAMPDAPPIGHVDRYALVAGRDGQRVLFSLGELHPALGRLEAYLVEHCENGAQAIGDSNLQLVVRGDAMDARSVRHVDAITVITAP